jgi:hypothetical protein
MNPHPRRLRAAAALGVLGGSLGVLAGGVQTGYGTDIPAWTGDKASPVALGLLTILLSGIAVLCAVTLRRQAPPAVGSRVAAAVGLAVPGGLCFSTVGRLWYLPGVLLLAATVFTIASTDLRQTRQVIASNWMRGLITALGAFELLMAVSAGPVITIAVGVVGGLALAASPWVPAARLRLLLLLVGALPFAILTWWSLVTPALAVLAISIGLTSPRHPFSTLRFSLGSRFDG